MMQTSEAERRANARQVTLLGEIGLLDWQIKQLTAQQEAKYREVDAMLRELPFAQALERDLLARQPEPQAAQGSAPPQAPSANGTAQTETAAASLEQLVARAEALEDKALSGQRPTPKRRPAKKQPIANRRGPSKRVTAKPAPAPVQAVAGTTPKRGRGRPRKHPPSPPPVVDIIPARAGNGAEVDLDAAFGAM